MNEHFRAFSFVDRITVPADGARIEGSYMVPSDLENFPSALVAEAVGQLAAWGSMNAMNFERRPVAGLAGKIELLAGVQPGQVLQLAADIESLDVEAMAYRGSATIDGTPIIRLEECLGPMIPVTDLDDPVLLRERFALLCRPGAQPGGFRGLPPLVVVRTNGEHGVWAKASFQVPASADLFADHFPRRPVFPGSLLMQVVLELAAMLAAEIPRATASAWRLESVLDMKLREFIPPGKSLQLEARLKQRTTDSATLTLTVRAGEDTVGTARVQLAPEDGR